MKRIGSVLAVVVAVGALGVYRGGSQSTPPPNILVIMADDFGWPFYGFMRELARSPGTFPHRLEHDVFPVRPVANEHEKVLAFQTPNLDALAARGAVFPAGHAANSVCHPSFKTTLTGVRENHYQGNYKGTVEKSMADYLGAEGQLAPVPYDTFGFGKIWHSSYKGLGFNCLNQGEDGCESVRSKAVGRREITPLLDFMRDAGPSWFAWYSPRLPHGTFQGRTIVEQTLKGEHNGKDSDLILLDFWHEFDGAPGTCQEHPGLDESDLANCRPGDCREVLENLCFRMRQLDGLRNLRKRATCEDITEVPTDPDCTTLYTPEEMKALMEQQSLQKSDFAKAYPHLSGMHEKYFSNILLLDFFVGQILRELQESEKDADTLILWTSDNGFALPKSKKTFGEDGFRSVIMASLPGEIPAGLVREQLVHAIDFVPTIFHYAGMTNIRQFPQDTTCTYSETNLQHPDALGQNVDNPCLEGESMHPYLVEPAPAGRPFLYGAKRNHGAYLRTNYGGTNYRLNLRNGGELFDLDADQDQSNNLFDAPPLMVQGVLGDWVAQLENWERCGDPEGLHPKCQE